MSEIKTVCVFLKFRTKGEDWIYNMENGNFGGNTDYPTANDFIQMIITMHRRAGTQMQVLNVVIG